MKKIYSIILCLCLANSNIFAEDIPVNNPVMDFINNVGKFIYADALTACAYGAPIYVMEVTRQYMTTTTADHYPNAPEGVLGFADRLATSDDKWQLLANNDTLYSTAWLDLSKHSYVLQTPNFGDRCYVYSLVNAYGWNFKNISKKTCGSGPGAYILVGPQFEGRIPENNLVRIPGYPDIEIIVASSNFVYLYGRVLVYSNDDLPTARTLQTSVSLQTWEDYIDVSGIPPTLASFYNPDPAKQTVEYTFNEYLPTSLKFYDMIGQFFRNTPPDIENVDIQEYGPSSSYGLLKLLGIDENGFDISRISNYFIPALAGALPDYIATAKSIWQVAYLLNPTINGWWRKQIDVSTTPSSVDLISAGLITVLNAEEILKGWDGKFGPGYLKTEETIYYHTSGNGAGILLSGENQYVVHFDQEPPVDAFWSVASYSIEDWMLIPNPINRYSIGDRTEGLQKNPDGSFDIYLSYDQPITGTTNWLPVCQDNFQLLMRLYNPQDAAYTGSWLPPAIQIVE